MVCRHLAISSLALGLLLAAAWGPNPTVAHIQEQDGDKAQSSHEKKVRKLMALTGAADQGKQVMAGSSASRS